MTATADMTLATQLDEAKSQAFVDRFINRLNESALMLTISIGHRTGLFDVLGNLPPATSQRIAEVAGLNERYVREWLGAMVTGKIVDYNPDKKTYALPPEHARWLTRDAAPENLAITAQWFSVLGRVEDDIVDRFKQGGGVHYHCFHRFHEVMAAESSQTVVAALEDHILPLEPKLRSLLQRGIDVLEVGCGSGLALCRLASLFPQSRFTGYDLCDDAIAAAKREAQRLELTNVRFEAFDVTGLQDQDRYDLVCGFDVIHDQKAPATVLDNVYRALKRGGTMLFQDIAASSYLEKNIENPIGSFLYTISTMHCMTVSLAQGGEGLGTCWGEELAMKMFAEAGFTDVRMHKLPHDFMNNYYVAHK